MKLKVEYVSVSDLTQYEGNARKHQEQDVTAIANSIEQFGFSDPIGVWGKKNTIVEGHGRLLAAIHLGLTEVPIIRLDHLTDDERRAYALAHNKTAELSSWDFEKLENELNELDDVFDMSVFGFDFDTDLDPEDIEDEEKYTKKIETPQYTPIDEDVELSDCLNTEKYDELIEQIQHSNLNDDEKDFLKLAAARHLRFNYKKIANYYARSINSEMKELMEKSALVIIDYGDAIQNGYAVMRGEILDLIKKEGYDA